MIGVTPPSPPGAALSDAVLARLRDALRDHYLVERELGAGGAATVYLARDLRHDRPVAIKVLRPDLAATIGADRFTREIRTSANLHHPHILAVHDSGVADGLLYYVMPVESESLRARLARDGPLPIVDAVRVLREVADALAFAHAHGVVHRDIKPDNVLLSGRHALVADFGVAKALSDASGQQAITTVGVALGTPAYMAPEQASADPYLDHRVDIYAFGVLGFELLVGEPPFVRRTPQQVIAAHMSEPAPRVSQRRPSVPPALDALIAKCLEKEPGDRWQSAEEIVAALEALSTPTAGTQPFAAPSAPSRFTPARLLAVGIGAAVLVAVATGGWLMSSRNRTALADPNVVAVLPFEFSGTPELAYLREGIVNVLEANLTGEGGPRAVASQTAIAQWKRLGGNDDGVTEEEGRAIARQLGAGYLIRGSIVGTPANLIVSATLLPSGSGGPPVQARESGPADSIVSIASRLAGQLLSLRVGEGVERSASLQAVPPAALRAYLEGQEAYRAARYDEAVKAFDRALSVDSTFAIAAMFHSFATGFNIATYGTSNGVAIANRHHDRLSRRDLALLEMMSPTTFAGRALSGREAMAVRERLVILISDRPEAWYELGDSYLHFGEVYGFTHEESFARADNAFRRALQLDPTLEYVRGHVADMALFAGDDARYLVLTDSLGLSPPYHALAKAILKGDSAETRRIAARFSDLSIAEILLVAPYATLAGAPANADAALKQTMERPGSIAERRGTLRAAQSWYAMMGRPSDVARADERMRALEENDEPAFPEDAIYLTIFSDVSPATGARSARFLERRFDVARSRGDGGGAAAAWLVGLWAAFREDTAKAADAVRYLDALAAQRDTSGNAKLHRLRADALRLVLDQGAPRRELLQRADSALRDGPPVGAEARAAMNVVVARSWERLGDVRRAAAAISRTSHIDGKLAVVDAALRDQGRMLLAAGDTAGALRTWRIYLRMRGTAEPAQRTADDEIRRTLATIERAKQ